MDDLGRCTACGKILLDNHVGECPRCTYATPLRRLKWDEFDGLNPYQIARKIELLEQYGFAVDGLITDEMIEKGWKWWREHGLTI